MMAGAVYVFVRSGATWSQQAYIKASNTEASDTFGNSISLSADGNTMAVGAQGEDSNATGINGNQANNSIGGAGAVYVFTRSGTTWSQQAYVKGANSDTADGFGHVVALASDGNTLAVSAQSEYSNATGINGNSANNTATNAGAIFVFARAGVVWSQQAYIKASNTRASDFFGRGMALSSDGNTLAVGANQEDSNATGVGGNQADNSMMDAGAAYVFVRSGVVWSQQAYIKASNTQANDYYGSLLALSGDGNTLAVVAADASDATGINGDATNNNAISAGAVFVYSRSGVVWSQQAYVKASNTDAADRFGSALALDSDGNTLVVGAAYEDGAGVGLDADPSSNAATSAGAAYVYTRSGVTWSHRAYLKPLNTGAGDQFGTAIAISTDNHTLAIGASSEASNATGINGDQSNNSAANAGAAYVFQL